MGEDAWEGMHRVEEILPQQHTQKRKDIDWDRGVEKHLARYCTDKKDTLRHYHYYYYYYY